MFRPIIAAAVIVLAMSVSSCASGPKPAAKAPTPGTQRIEIPAGANEEEPTVSGHNLAACEASCDRSYRICGDEDRGASSSDRVESLTAPRLFGQASECRRQLEQCFNRCKASR